MFKASQICCSVVPHTQIKHCRLYLTFLMQPFVPKSKEDTPHCFLRTERQSWMLWEA